MNFGKWLREKREEKNLSMRQLGKLSGINYNVIFRYENDKNPNPGLRNVERLCKALNVRLWIGKGGRGLMHEEHFSKLEIAIEAKQAQIDAAEKELAELREELRRIEALARKEGA